LSFDVRRGGNGVIDEYLSEFERWTVGPPTERESWRAELAAHLGEAERAGELDDALRRLGSPREAAATFSRSGRWDLAALGRRWRAAAVDYAPLAAVALALAVWQNVFSRTDNVFSFGLLSFPPPLGLVINTERALAENIVWNCLVLGAGLWSFLGLALIESRTGRTPGKRLVGLATISEDGTAVSLQQALIRRIPLWFGPVFWIDLLTLCTARRQRVFELLARTRVIEDPVRVLKSSDVRG
jgi:uncharacterized RDD family membrane protein YckC